MTVQRVRPGTAQRTRITPVRVASVPSGHPYVRNLAHPDRSEGVHRLPDPTEPWWPPRMLDPEWVAENAQRFEVYHVHFGYDAVDPCDLDRLCVLLHDLGKPIVITAHDLRNPHHDDGDLHERQLGVWMAHADRVITLTDRAAGLIAERYGRRAIVAPHPHIMPLDELPALQRLHRERPRPPKVVGLHFKSLRPNMIGRRALDAVVRGASGHPDAVVRVNLHRDIGEPDGARYDPDLAQRAAELAERGAIELQIHDCFDDDAFNRYIAGLDVSVLPYRFGTHSGWQESCRDVGVGVVAPDCGCYADQGPVFGYRSNEADGFDGDSLAAAVSAALDADPPEPVPVEERREERRRLAELHRDLYLELIG